MGIKTEDFVKNMPPKMITAGIDWLKILDDFNPSVIAQRYGELTQQYECDIIMAMELLSNKV